MASTDLTYEERERLVYELESSAAFDPGDGTYFEGALRALVAYLGQAEGIEAYCYWRWAETPEAVAADFGIIEPEED